eukprot:3935420-Rhodomonas_salina.1
MQGMSETFRWNVTHTWKDSGLEKLMECTSVCGCTPGVDGGRCKFLIGSKQLNCTFAILLRPAAYCHCIRKPYYAMI